METKDLKNKLRIKLSDELKKFNPSEINSNTICLKVLKFIHSQEPRKIFSFVEMRHEVTISSIFNEILNEGLQIFVPYFQDGNWMIAEIEEGQQWKKNKFGTLQPEKPKVIFKNLLEIDFDKTDIAIVPGLAFSKQNDRLGFGAGTYDKYLSNVSCFKIGLCFNKFYIESLPKEPHDIKMDLVITEN